LRTFYGRPRGDLKDVLREFFSDQLFRVGYGKEVHSADLQAFYRTQHPDAKLLVIHDGSKQREPVSRLPSNSLM
jgi:hypothetical protein